MALLNSPFRKWFAVAAVLALLLLTHPLWLAALGGYLVQSETPVRADVALVLAGDQRGDRILQAASLVKQGYTGLVLVSGPEGIYGHNEAELAISFAIRKGYPAEWFAGVPIRALSTREEAAALAPELQKRGVRKCLLVTSNFHTRRALRIFRSTIPSVEFHIVGAEDPYFRPGSWWKVREAQEVFVIEWVKTAAAWFGN